MQPAIVVVEEAGDVASFANYKAEQPSVCYLPKMPYSQKQNLTSCYSICYFMWA